MQKVIGLDIGSYSIKAVEIVNTFKSYEVTNFYETIIPNLEGVPLDAVVPVCMEQLFTEHDLQADRIITAMPGQFISSRVIPFNFSDSRKIEASMLLELEDYVPFDISEMVVDHQILGTSDGKTLALAVMTRKPFLRNFLNLLSRVNIDPKLVDVDSLASYNLSGHLVNEESDSYALVDIGNEKTSVCIVQDGLLRMFRSINIGGRYITDFLARDLETTFHHAQRTKHRVSRLLYSQDQGEDLSPDDLAVAQACTLASNAIVKELGRTFYSYKSWSKAPLEKIILSGGTSKFQNIGAFLSEQLEIPVEHFSLENTDLAVNSQLNACEHTLPQSLAIGLRAVSNVKKYSQINLRKGEFAYVQNYETVLKTASAAFKLVSIIMAALLVTYIIKYQFYAKQISEVKSAYVKEFVARFPDAKRKYLKGDIPFSKLRNDSEMRLKEEIRFKQDAISEFQLMNTQSPTLKLLKDVSLAIPKDLKLDVSLFEYRATGAGLGNFTLKAETDNFSSGASIIEALAKVSNLKDVEEKQSGRKPGSDGKIIEFTVNAKYEAIP
jgi:type IV pilus assembly protein PilM